MAVVEASGKHGVYHLAVYLGSSRGPLDSLLPIYHSLILIWKILFTSSSLVAKMDRHLARVMDVSISKDTGQPMRASMPSYFDEASIASLLTIVAWVALAVLIVKYIVDLLKYHWANQIPQNGTVPPVYPSFLPVLGTSVPFILDNERFFRQATYVCSKIRGR